MMRTSGAGRQAFQKNSLIRGRGTTLILNTFCETITYWTSHNGNGQPALIHTVTEAAAYRCQLRCAESARRRQGFFGGLIMPSASAANLCKMPNSLERSMPPMLAHRSNRYVSLRQSVKKSSPISGFFGPCATTRAASLLRWRRDNSEAPERCSSPMRKPASSCASRCRSASTRYRSSTRVARTRLSANHVRIDPLARPRKKMITALMISNVHSPCHVDIREQRRTSPKSKVNVFLMRSREEIEHAILPAKSCHAW
jgi:hypothetical protein